MNRAKEYAEEVLKHEGRGFASKTIHLAAEFIRIEELMQLSFPEEKNIDQNALMKYDPKDGTGHPYPSHADQYRNYHGKVAWLCNPWSGDIRTAEDVGSDTFGHLIVPLDAKLSGAK